MEVLEKYLKENLINKLQKSYRINNDIRIDIISNIQKGLLEKYFFENGSKETNNIRRFTIYNIDDDFDNIPDEIKELSLSNGLRAKRIQSGYYNLHHFGTKICFIEQDETFYIFGKISDNNKLIWSYLIKMILAKYSMESGILHLKGTVIKVKEKGLLIIGDKASGKTTLAYNILKNAVDGEFLTNTHVMIKDNYAAGIRSKINFRKSIVENIQKIDKKLLNLEVKGCMNISPLDLDYKIIDKCKIDYVIFYRYNESGKLNFIDLDKNEMKVLIQTFAEADNVYGINGDVNKLYHNDIKKFAKYKLNKEIMIENLVNNAKSKFLSMDIYSDNLIDNIEELLEQI